MTTTAEHVRLAESRSEKTPWKKWGRVRRICGEAAPEDILQRRRDEHRHVNYAANQSQCYVRLPRSDPSERAVRFNDLIGEASFDRVGNDFASRGLYLDLPRWGYDVRNP